MQRFVMLILFVCGFASAAFIDVDLKDSRLQMDSYVHEPGGILGFAFEFGVFNEPQNMVDYTLAIGISRYGYSHSDGDVSVSVWDIYIKPLVWSVTVKNITFEVNAGWGYILSTNNFNSELNDAVFDRFKDSILQTYVVHRSALKYGYRLGYRITDQIQISLVANYQYMLCEWYGADTDTRMFTGGWGLNFQWNIPWIPF